MPLPIPRTYSANSAGNIMSSFTQLFDRTGVQYDSVTNVPYQTGIWRALEPSDLAPTISAINISGINIAVDQLEGMVSSGAQYLAFISGAQAFLSGQQSHTYTTVSSSSISGSMSAITTGIGLQANALRKKVYAQVIGSGGPLWLGYGAAPSAQSFNVALKAASSDPGMDGGTLSDSDYRGAILVSGYIGCRYTLWEGV